MLDYNVIGLRLRRARADKGLTQQELAEKTGLAVAFISRVERGSTHINLKRLSEFCTILGISEGEILNGVSNADGLFLHEEFEELLNNCPQEKMKLIYKIAKLIVEDEEY